MIHFPYFCLILLPTLTPLLRLCRMKDTTARDMLDKVTHEPETYARHRQDLVLEMERVLRTADISQERVKLST